MCCRLGESTQGQAGIVEIRTVSAEKCQLREFGVGRFVPAENVRCKFQERLHTIEESSLAQVAATTRSTSIEHWVQDLRVHHLAEICVVSICVERSTCLIELCSQ